VETLGVLRLRSLQNAQTAPLRMTMYWLVALCWLLAMYWLAVDDGNCESKSKSDNNSNRSGKSGPWQKVWRGCLFFQ
jgi:hypothetical protein